MDFNLISKLKKIKSFKKKYRLKGLYFYQEELLYEEDGQVADIVKSVLELVQAKKGWEEIVIHLYQSKAIPKLFLVILKVDESLHRKFINQHIRKKYDINKGDEVQWLVPNLNNSEMMRVVIDFFFINLICLTSLLDIQSLLDCLNPIIKKEKK
jgi:hypothetical protein